jgi:glycosyltransferase involved in cell wall biosynthesis
MNPLVSILIPAYNAGEWIADTLESAVRQTWKNKEIIVVDDGSTDNTREVAEAYVSRGVSVTSQPNRGAAATRNEAFSRSQGDYIQWLDADDLLAPDKIASQVALLDRGVGPRTVISGAWGSFMFRPERAEFVPTPLWCDLSPTEWLVRKMTHNLHMQTATWLVSRALTQAAGPWNTKLLGDDDGEYFCRVLLASDTVRFVPEAKVYYRMAGPTSLSYIGSSNQKLDAQFRSMELHISYLRSLEQSDRVQRACVAYLQNWLAHFYPDRPDIIDRAKALAAEFGGELTPPEFSWKYTWIQSLFGAHAAKRAQVSLRRVKWSLVRRWDRALSRNPRLA